MALWQEILTVAVPLLTLVGGGIRWLLVWLIGRFEATQKNFLDELEKLEETRERHRQEHLADTKLYATSMAKTAEFLQKLPASQRPPQQ